MILMFLLHTYSREQDLVEEIYQLILETVQTEKDMTDHRQILSGRICKGKLLKFELFAYQYVLECMDKILRKSNIKQYLLAALFNHHQRFGSYYKAAVNHDMPGVTQTEGGYL